MATTEVRARSARLRRCSNRARRTVGMAAEVLVREQSIAVQPKSKLSIRGTPLFGNLPNTGRGGARCHVSSISTRQMRAAR